MASSETSIFQESCLFVGVVPQQKPSFSRILPKRRMYLPLDVGDLQKKGGWGWSRRAIRGQGEHQTSSAAVSSRACVRPSQRRRRRDQRGRTDLARASLE